MADVENAIETLRAGGLALLPTDTVYGLCASPYREGPVRHLYRLKGRGESEPTALVASSVDMLLECVPELRGRAGVIARTLLPGPYTLVLPNPARRFRWLAGVRSDALGVRVPDLPDGTARVLDALGAVAATSANDPGGADPATLDEVPERIRAVCASVDAGRLPGTASTVIDFTGDEPQVLREGAGLSTEALARVREALSA